MPQNETYIDFETPISTKELFQAILRKSNRKNYGWNEAVCRKYAETAMNFFGNSDRFLDQIIESSDRESIYLLQELGIVTREVDEGDYEFYIQKTGERRGYYFKAWKIFSWVLNVGEVRRTLQEGEENIISSEAEAPNAYNKDSLQEDWDLALEARNHKKPNGATA